jgi:hypothetical protein
LTGGTAVTVDTTEEPLAGRGSRALPFGGGCALLLGLFFICFALVFVLGWWAAGWFPLVLKAPELAIGVCTLTFVIGLGIGLTRSGILGGRRAARAKKLAALHPDQPWFADYPWDPRGTYEPPLWGPGSVLTVAFVFLIMAPFNVAWRFAFDPLTPVEERLLIGAMLFIPNFFVYLVLKAVFMVLKDRWRFGRAYLAFDPFPFFLGEMLAARVTAKAFAGQEGVVATLRCIDERMVRRRYRGGHSTVVVPYQVYEARLPFPGRFGGEDVPVTFALPAQPTTALVRQPPCYWELEIRGRRKADTVAFTVPVYARPPSASPQLPSHVRGQ